MYRILYTLEHGTVVSKLAAARWAQGTLAAVWASLIESALAGRLDPRAPADPGEVARTLELLRYTVDFGLGFRHDSDGNAEGQ